jgi:hypothetical protein
MIKSKQIALDGFPKKVNISPIIFIFIIGILLTFFGNYAGAKKSIKSAQFPLVNNTKTGKL